MKKNILAIAIATAVAAPAAMADAKIYGYFNGAMENASEAGTQMDSRNSRIGIKGSEDLGNGLKAIYQFETGIDLMSGKFNNADRNTFLGLNGNFGTVLFGKHDTPLRMIQPSDAFADGKYTGNNRSSFNGLSPKEGSGEDRLSNVLAYISPDFGGFQFALAGANGAKQTDDNSPANMLSGSVSYGKKSDGLYLAAGVTQVDKKVGLHDYDNSTTTPPVVDTFTDSERTNIRVTAQYKADGLTAYAMYNNVEIKGLLDEGTGKEKVKGELNSFTLGASYKVGDFTPKAKVAFVDPKGGDDFTNFAIGSDYALGKNTAAFLEVAQLDKKAGLTQNKKGEDKDTTVISIGMNHKF